MSVRDRELRNMQQKFAKILVWWAKKSDEYPYQVEVPLSFVRDENMPELFDEYGRHIMAHLRPNWRTYAFAAKKDADAFMRKYPHCSQPFSWQPAPTKRGGLIL